MKKVLLDCDPGIDDSIALILALKSPELNIEAITSVTGNLQADKTALNVQKILTLMNRSEIPVAQGNLTPLNGVYPHDPFSHGEDGLGNTHLPDPLLTLSQLSAAEEIVRVAKRFPAEITLIATGPLTNVASALLLSSDIAQLIRELIIIGGSFGFNQYAYQNATGGNPASEWNIYVDPEAAKIVFRSGIKITAIGLDVATHPEINIRPKDRQRLEKAGTLEACYFLDLIRFVEERNFQSYCVLIDSMAVAAAINPNIVQTKEIYVDVETQGELTRGQTVVDHRINFQWKHLPRIVAAFNADFPAFLDLLINRIAL